ncbi:MAG: hypothetical protein R3Y23_06755, partial [Bacillota bacterium]
MTVIKKTIVLSKGATKGYITVVKIGSQAAAKMHLNQLPKSPQWLLVKIGALEPIAYEVHAAYEEYALPHEFAAGDNIGVAVVNRQGEIYAFGGNRYGLDIQSFVDSLQEKLVDISDVVECVDCEKEEESADIGYQEPIVEEPKPEIKEEIAEIPLAPIEENEQAVEVDNIVEEEVVEPIKKKRKYTKSKSTAKDTESKIEEEPIVKGAAEESIKVKKGSSPNKANRAENIADEDNFNEMFSETEIANFYSTIQARLEDLFVINPRETELAGLIPD